MPSTLCKKKFLQFKFRLSTAISVTAVLIHSVRSNQKLQTADFRCTPPPLSPQGSMFPPASMFPPHWQLAFLGGRGGGTLASG